MGMVAAGLVIGAPVAVFGQRFAASLIQDLPANNATPIVFGAVAMIAGALIAAYVPAVGQSGWTQWQHYGTSKRDQKVARGR